LKSTASSDRFLTSLPPSDEFFTSLPVSDESLTFLPVTVIAAYELPPKSMKSALVAMTLA
jgi:hypothetical protein